jgi:hypothetical protein
MIAESDRVTLVVTRCRASSNVCRLVVAVVGIVTENKKPDTQNLMKYYGILPTSVYIEIINTNIIPKTNKHNHIEMTQ